MTKTGRNADKQRLQLFRSMGNSHIEQCWRTAKTNYTYFISSNSVYEVIMHEGMYYKNIKGV